MADAAAFDWNAHPIVSDSAQTQAPAQSGGGFNWNDHPVVTPAAPAAAGEATVTPYGSGGKLDTVARTLDYAGGYNRSLAAGAVGDLTGHPNIVSPTDQANIAQGKGPNSAEYLKRLGVSEGPSINLPWLGHTSLRDVEGFALDVAADPLTEIGNLIKAAPGISKAVSEITGLGADATAKAVGEAIYKSGFSKIDAKMAEKGAEPISQLLLDSGAPAGTTAQVGQKVQVMAQEMDKARDALYDKATQAGAAVDLSSQPLTKTESYVQDLIQDKRASVRAQGEALAEHLQSEYRAAGPVDLATLSSWKTDLYNTLPKDFFTPTGKMTPIGKKFNAYLASDFKNAIVDTGNSVEKGLGDSINAINERWGTLLNAAKPIAQQATQAAGKPIFSPLKAVVTAHNPLLGAAMEGADIAGTTAVRTSVGSGMISAGSSGFAGNAARQTLIHSQQGPTTLGQSVMHGNGAQNALQQAGPKQ